MSLTLKTFQIPSVKTSATTHSISAAIRAHRPPGTSDHFIWESPDALLATKTKPIQRPLNPNGGHTGSFIQLFARESLNPSQVQKAESAARAEHWERASKLYYQIAEGLKTQPTFQIQRSVALALSASYGDRALFPANKLLPLYEEAGDELKVAGEPLLADACLTRALEMAESGAPDRVKTLEQKLDAITTEDYSESVSAWTAALGRADRRSKHFCQRKLAELHAARAWVFLRDKKFEEAQADFREEDLLLANAYQNPLAMASHRLRRGSTLWDSQHRDLAFQDFSRVEAHVTKVLSNKRRSTNTPDSQTAALLSEMNIQFHRRQLYDLAMTALVHRENLTTQDPHFAHLHEKSVEEVHRYLESNRAKISLTTQAFLAWTRGHIEMSYGQYQEARAAFIESYELCLNQLRNHALGHTMAQSLVLHNTIGILEDQIRQAGEGEEVVPYTLRPMPGPTPTQADDALRSEYVGWMLFHPKSVLALTPADVPIDETIDLAEGAEYRMAMLPPHTNWRNARDFVIIAEGILASGKRSLTDLALKLLDTTLSTASNGPFEPFSRLRVLTDIFHLNITLGRYHEARLALTTIALFSHEPATRSASQLALAEGKSLLFAQPERSKNPLEILWDLTISLFEAIGDFKFAQKSVPTDERVGAVKAAYAKVIRFILEARVFIELNIPAFGAALETAASLLSHLKTASAQLGIPLPKSQPPALPAGESEASLMIDIEDAGEGEEVNERPSPLGPIGDFVRDFLRESQRPK